MAETLKRLPLSFKFLVQLYHYTIQYQKQFWVNNVQKDKLSTRKSKHFSQHQIPWFPLKIQFRFSRNPARYTNEVDIIPLISLFYDKIVINFHENGNLESYMKSETVKLRSLICGVKKILSHRKCTFEDDL